MSPLYARLHLWAVTPHEWGFTDCYMTLVDWVRDETGHDAGEALRGSYGNPDLCPIARRLRADPIPVADDLLAQIGLQRTDAPLPGDVGIIRHRGQRHLFGGLCLGENWASKCESDGVLIARPLEVVAAWSVDYAG
ncbi:MAG: DUF6950 family protein [Glycocaulis sp.]